jgi:hypothetical protein
MSLPLNRIVKDPAENIDYTVNYGPWLQKTTTGDTISSVVWTVPPGITKTGQSNTTTTATVWLSGGQLGKVYTITCIPTTASNRTQPYSFEVSIQSK